MYCVEWNTRKASPARKSREESRPATGLSVNPVQSETIYETDEDRVVDEFHQTDERGFIERMVSVLGKHDPQAYYVQFF